MQKVLAVAAVGSEHKELVFKELKKIAKKIKVSLEILLQEEIINANAYSADNGNILQSYPYITLNVPDYEQRRESTSYDI